MMMEIVLSEEKAKQFNYPIERCYEILDNFFNMKGITKIGKGIYQCKEYGKMASAQVALPKSQWFMNIVEVWYCRYASDDISAREDCYDFYFNRLKKRPYEKCDETRKAINFDLNDRLLKENYPSNKSYKNAWQDLGKYLKNYEFEHRQYSGYVSKNILEYQEVNHIIEDVSRKLPWLKECVEKFDVTAVFDDYDLMDVIKDVVVMEEIS